MMRYNLSPSDDERWVELARRVIRQAECEDVDLREFYRGLVTIMDEIDDRLAVSQDELRE